LSGGDGKAQQNSHGLTSCEVVFLDGLVESRKKIQNTTVIARAQPEAISLFEYKLFVS
jgi:hypothetical protein